MTDTPKNNKGIKEALTQTISDDAFNSEAVRELSETLGDDHDRSHRINESIEQILEETIDDQDPSDSAQTTFGMSHFQETLADNESTTERINSNIAHEQMNAFQNERYTLKAAIGSGGTGQVFLAHDNNFNRDIAVKFMHPRDATNKSKLLKFIDEARITAKLDHPNILPIHNLDYTSGTLIYFTMGCAEGQSLQQLIETYTKTGRLPSTIRSINDRIRIIVNVCKAIAYAHSIAIIHNDIKPSNIMIGQFGEVLVVDWGTASNDRDKQSEKRLFGTPLYMSPEQARREGSSTLSDIYCIGTTLFHLLTLRFPCWHDNLDIFWEMKRTGAICDFTKEEQQHLGPELTAIVYKAIAPLPADRYQDPKEIIKDLEAYQQGQAVSAYRDTFVGIIRRIYRSNKSTVLLVLISALIISLSLIWLVYEKVSFSNEWQVVHDVQFNETFKPQQLAYLFDSNHPEHLHLGSHGLEISTQPNRESALAIKQRHQGNIRASWSINILQQPQQLNFFIGGPTKDNSYRFELTKNADHYELNVYRQNQLLYASNTRLTLDINTPYTIQLSKDNQNLSFAVSNGDGISFTDPDVLMGSNFEKLGFTINDGSATITKILTQHQNLSHQNDPLEISHIYYSEALFNEALEHYKQLQSSYPHSAISTTAQYKIARCLDALGQKRLARLHYQQFSQQHPQHQLQPYAVTQLICSHISSSQYRIANDLLNKMNPDPELRPFIIAQIQRLTSNQSDSELEKLKNNLQVK